jgi:hypothetical protein
MMKIGQDPAKNRKSPSPKSKTDRREKEPSESSASQILRDSAVLKKEETGS